MKQCDTPSDREALIEQIARGIQEADGLEGMQFWEDVPERQRRQYIHVARHGLERAEAAGVVCVPAAQHDAYGAKFPRAMVRAGEAEANDWHDMTDPGAWVSVAAAMIAASLYAKKGA